MKSFVRIIGCGTVLWTMAFVPQAWGQMLPQSGPEENGPAQHEAEDGFAGVPDPSPGRGRGGMQMQAPGKGLEGVSPRERREKMRKRVAVMRMLRMTEALELDEETAARLFAGLRPIDQERWSLIREKRSLQRELKKQNDSENPDAAVLKRIMSDLEKNKRAMFELEEKERKLIRRLLTPVQQAKYEVFKDHFGKEMKARIQKARKNRLANQPPNRPGRPAGH